MPLYDFRCTGCGIKFEEYAKMDDKITGCTECGGTATRLITSNYHIQADYASKDWVTSDITGSEVRITSRKQLRKLCNDHGVYAKEGPAANKTKYRREEMADRQRSQPKKRQYFNV